VAVVRHALELQSPLATTWALVANTDRSDAAAGLPKIDYTDSPVDDGTSRRTFSYRLKGLAVEGEEQPLRWEFPRFYEVRRTYSRGPFRRTFHRCEPRAVDPEERAAGTHVLHRFDLSTRSSTTSGPPSTSPRASSPRAAVTTSS